MSAPLSEFADFALELARAARVETLPRWSASCPAEDKGTDSFDPVTEADREAERVIRSLIQGRFPEHGITGEEWPDTRGNGPLAWSLDPIDGTRSFVCRLPTWVTLIALLEEGRPIVGVIDAPGLDEVYLGSDNQAWLIAKGERTRLMASGCTRLADARLSTTDPFECAPPAELFEPIRKAARVTRYGHDGYAYARLAAGSIDLVIEAGLKPHDYNALVPVVMGAGGRIGDWDGGQELSNGRILAAATPELYDEVVGLLARAA